MSGSHADMSKHVKMYLGVLSALFVCTILTVYASTVNMGHATNMTVALLIAAFKASLVAMIFMHLKWEGSKIIWITLALCALFFSLLLFLPMLTTTGLPASTVYSSWG